MSKARKGIPLTTKTRAKLSASLSRKMAFFGLSPSNEHVQGDDLRSFCKERDLSYHCPRNITSRVIVITKGRNKGWAFSKSADDDLVAIRDRTLTEIGAKRTERVTRLWSSGKRDRKLRTFYAVSPDNAHHAGSDLQSWSEKHGLSLYTTREVWRRGCFVITQGKGRGWILSSSPIENPIEYREAQLKTANRRHAEDSRWTRTFHTASPSSR